MGNQAMDFSSKTHSLHFVERVWNPVTKVIAPSCILHFIMLLSGVAEKRYQRGKTGKPALPFRTVST